MMIRNTFFLGYIMYFMIRLATHVFYNFWLLVAAANTFLCVPFRCFLCLLFCCYVSTCWIIVVVVFLKVRHLFSHSRVVTTSRGPSVLPACRGTTWTPSVATVRCVLAPSLSRATGESSVAENIEREAAFSVMINCHIKYVNGKYFCYTTMKTYLV